MGIVELLFVVVIAVVVLLALRAVLARGSRPNNPPG